MSAIVDTDRRTEPDSAGTQLLENGVQEESLTFRKYIHSMEDEVKEQLEPGGPLSDCAASYVRLLVTSGVMSRFIRHTSAELDNQLQAPHDDQEYSHDQRYVRYDKYSEDTKRVFKPRELLQAYITDPTNEASKMAWCEARLGLNDVFDSKLDETMKLEAMIRRWKNPGPVSHEELGWNLTPCVYQGMEYRVLEVEKWLKDSTRSLSQSARSKLGKAVTLHGPLPENVIYDDFNENLKQSEEAFWKAVPVSST